MSVSELSELFERYMAAPVDSEADDAALKSLCCLLAQKNSNAELRAKIKDLEQLANRIR